MARYTIYGGSWFISSGYARTSYYSWNPPLAYNTRLNFRIVKIN